jgi:hypothetical protein
VKPGIGKYRERFFLSGLSAGLRAEVRYNPFTAADEKIPLSMEQVNNKPLHLVFCSHSRHSLHKQREMSVESVNGRAGRGFESRVLLQFRCSPQVGHPRLTLFQA